MKTAVVTGGSSGIGLKTAELLRDTGYKVFEISRRRHENAGIKHISADVTDTAALEAAFAEIIKSAGTVDLVVCCAGMGVSGAVEFTEPVDAKRQLDVNFFGMVNVCHAVLPIMRKAGHGRIVNTSSVAGVVPIPFQTFYSASKAAINSYTMSLANEVRPFGIQVCAVMPGDIRTGFTAARKKSQAGDEIYSGRISRSVAGMEHDEQTGMAPETAGAYIASVATRKSVKPLRAIGLLYKFYCLLVKLLPVRALNWLVRMIYAK
mgnify:CR=1 FL=1